MFIQLKVKQFREKIYIYNKNINYYIYIYIYIGIFIIFSHYLFKI